MVPGGDAAFRSQLMTIQGADSTYNEFYARRNGTDPAAKGTDAQRGTALARTGRLSEAVDCFRRALTVEPNTTEVHNNLGNALRELGQLDEAEAVLRRAIELRPDYAEAHNNLGVVLVKQHRVDDGVFEYRLAIKHKRNYAEAHLNRALAWLLLGDFQQGWPEYEWRWKTGLKLIDCAQPRWDGNLLEGKTLLLQSEQGLGDTLQFARYAALLRERGARVLLRCRKSLHPLLIRTPGIDELVGNDCNSAKFDCWSPLLSIPRLMLTTLDRIPSNGPYLFANEQFVEEWRHRLPHTDSFKVGICWQGGVRFVTDRQRSFPLESFSPLAGINGVELISLQKGEPDAPSPAHGGGSAGASLEDDRLSWLTVLQGERDQSRGAFMDTAAIISNLDLVITCDTSIAHLAGGLGMPVWVILQHAADWRWLLNRDDSPWYPTMRLFRQSSPGDWAGVFQRVAEALRELVAIRTPTAFPQGSVIWNRRAIAAAKRGRLPEAISLFRRAVRFQPDSAEMANNLGNALRNHGELSEATECLQRAVAIKPDYADAHHNLGLIYARQRRFDEAVAAFQHAIELKPGFAQCHNSLGQALADLGRHADAETSFRRAVESDSKFALAFNNLGNCLTNQGKRKEAISYFERAVKLDPKFADAFNNLGNVLRELRQHAKAIAAFERAVAIRPNFPQAHNNMGITYSARRKYDEALACYERALQIWPEYAAAYNNRGITLANRGDWADATVNYRRALELNPDYAEAKNNLGIVLSQQGDYEGALALFKQAIELKPDYAEAFSNMGITLTESRRIDEALESYAQALERKENYPDARMNRALSYLIRGDFERGWQEYEWRWKCKEFNARNFDKPEWDGSPLDDRRIMFHTEQGFGDTENRQLLGNSEAFYVPANRWVLKASPPDSLLPAVPRPMRDKIKGFAPMFGERQWESTMDATPRY